MTKIKMLLALFAIMCASLLVGSSPAHAGWPGGKVVHAGDDSGYNPPIPVRCDNGDAFSLGLGRSSWWADYPGQPTCGDVNSIYVGPGDQIKCQTRFTFNWTTYYATGWHDVGNFTDFSGCYQQKD